MELTGCSNEPLLSPHDVCRKCVLVEFRGDYHCFLTALHRSWWCTERLYAIEHPKLVQEFDEVSETNADTEGYWVSKQWIKGMEWFSVIKGVSSISLPDWRLLRPRMHKASQEDPAPDSLEYRNDVWCEHGLLALNHLNRRRISTEVKCPPWAFNFFWLRIP